MSKVKFENFEKGMTRDPNVFEVEINKIILVEDMKIGGYTAFFKPDIGIIAQGEKFEEAVFNLLETYKVVVESENIYLKMKKILPK
jgi:predicted RNase H-like HicB family nuclease